MNDLNVNSTNGSVSFDTYVSSVMKRVYSKMFLALIVTAASAYVVDTTAAIQQFMYANSWCYWVLMAAELIMVISLSARIHKISTRTATMLFYGYSVLNGVTLAAILSIYTMSSVFQTFLISAGVFGAMSVYGYTTKNDMTKFGSYLMMALVGLLIAVVVNIFVGSSQLEWIISFVGVGIFIGLTAWDTQNIKRMAAYSDSANAGKIATIGALSLYLDFINMFLYLLRFFGDRE